MNKKFEDINWEDVDFSDYKEDIEEINEYMNELLKRPSIKKALLKFKINDLQKKAELGEHYKHLYSEVKKQKDELETSYNILQKNNTTLAKQQEEAYKIADDFYKERQQLKKQKADAVKFVNEFIQEDYYEKLDEYITHFTWNTTKEDLLRMLGETNE